MYFNCIRRFIAVSALLCTGLAYGQTDDGNGNAIIVTASRTPETVDESLAEVTVITRDDIDRMQPHSIDELFAGLPGVMVANEGGYGKQTSVFMRGAESDQVLVLLDGIRIGAATSGAAAFEQIPVDQIERIEIVRGPRSSLYGSQPIGGVIQIFTRHGSDTLTPSFSVGGGSNKTVQSQAGLSGSFGPAWYSGSVAGFKTGGINACNGVPNVAGCFTYDPDQDGYRNNSISLRGGYTLSDGSEVSVDWLRVYGNTQYDGSYSDLSKEVQQVLGGTFKLRKIGIWQSSLTLGQSEDQATDYYHDDYAGFFNTQRNDMSWLNEFSIGQHQKISAGVDYLKDHVNSDPGYTSNSREDIGGFAQYQGDFGRNEIQLSARGDRDQTFGEHYTGAGAYGYRLASWLQVRASYGTAFEAPTFNDLYYPYYGNPGLHPEQSRSGELGFAGDWHRWSWGLTVYQSNDDDLITYDAATGQPGNVDRARIRGLDGQSTLTLDGWRLHADLTLLDPRDRESGPDDDHWLARRAQQTAKLDIDRQFQRFSVGATAFESGRRFDDLGNTQPLGGYGTVSLRAGIDLTRHWMLQAQLNNVFDKNYETAEYYNQLGRTFFFSLRYRPS